MLLRRLRQGCLIAAQAIAFLMMQSSASHGQTRADALFRAGVAQMEARDWAGAKRSFLGSHEAEPNISTLVNLAECEEMLGELLSARKRLEAAVALAIAKKSAKLTLAQERLRTLEVRIPRVQFRVTAPANGMRISWHGGDADLSALAAPIFFDPGAWVVDASAPGRRPWSGRIVVRQGGALTVVLVPELERIETVRVPPSSLSVATREPAAAAPSSSGGASGMPGGVPAMTTGRASPVHTGASIGLMGLGALAIGFGTYFGVQALSGYADSGCSANRCPTLDALDRYQASQRWAQASTWLISLGAATAAGGVLYFVLTRSSGRVELGAGSVRWTATF